MKPYYQQGKWSIYFSDCREILPSLDKASAIVTDPPYELGFMGKSWDSKGVSFQKETWEIIRDSCLSGAMLLSFGGTRTFHRIACAIEDAGWEYRDTVMWVYGSGFPKSRDIGKDMEKLKVGGIKNLEVIGSKQGIKVETGTQGFSYSKEYVAGKSMGGRQISGEIPVYKIDNAWQGYGTALKPAYEPIILAMNPLDGTFANNALKHGVAGLNIEECRIPSEIIRTIQGQSKSQQSGEMYSGKDQRDKRVFENSKGRFPANFIHDGSQMVMELFPNSKSSPFKSATTKGHHSIHGTGEFDYTGGGYVDDGSAARFFYCAKASKAERDRGCEGLELTQGGSMEANISDVMQLGGASLKGEHKPRQQTHNNHPTVKPLALMSYLVKLVKMPEYNLVIDPFCGSGTTLLACIKLGLPCIGIDNDEKSCEIAAKRCCQEVMELA